MAVPDYQTLMLPILQALSDGTPRSTRDVMDELVATLRLTDEDLNQRTPNGMQTTFYNRTNWAITYIAQAGLIERPKRGQVRITEQGRSLLSERPDRIDGRVLKRYPGFQEFQERKKRTPTAPTGSPEPEEVGNGEGTPDELLESSYQSLRNTLIDDLLDQIRNCSPAFFEQLVVDLLVSMGYGGSRVDAGQAVGRTGDGGIDGTIKEDKLGLDVVCIQAKRWSGTVGRPDVQAFVGSMEGRQATKGVFITTSSFSREADEYVRMIQRRIVLVDGRRLAELMIDHDIGVTTTRTYAVKRVDTDYFTEVEV